MNTIEYDINNVQICEKFKVKPLVIEAFDKDNNRHIDIHL